VVEHVIAKKKLSYQCDYKGGFFFVLKVLYFLSACFLIYLNMLYWNQRLSNTMKTRDILLDAQKLIGDNY